MFELLKDIKSENSLYKKADFTSLIKEKELFYELDKLQITLNLSFDEFMEISSLIHTGLKSGLYMFSKFQEFLEEDGFKIDKNKLKEINKLVEKFKNDISVWIYNGYTLKEFEDQI